MCPLDDASLGRCVPWTMRPLDDASPYDLSLTGGGGSDDVMLEVVQVSVGELSSGLLHRMCVIQRVRTLDNIFLSTNTIREFFGFFFLWTLFNTALSVSPQISLCRRMLGSNPLIECGEKCQLPM